MTNFEMMVECAATVAILGLFTTVVILFNRIKYYQHRIEILESKKTDDIDVGIAG